MIWMKVSKLAKMFLATFIFSILFLETTGKAVFKGDNVILLLEKTLSAFEKALEFYSEEYGLINFDSLFGLRVAQGSLRQLLIDVENLQDKNFVIGQSYMDYIGELYTTVDRIATKALPFVQMSNAQEYNKFYKIVMKPWMVFQPFQKLTPVTEKKELKPAKFDGPMSDSCIQSLLRSNSQGYSSCNVTGHCWQFETQRDLGGYTSTHQILYFLFGLGEGCGGIFDDWFKTTTRSNGVQDFFAEICGNILRSKHAKNTKSMSEMEKDLSMEQTLVCSLTGYEDFLTEEYLNVVLGWQTEIGCYGNKIPLRRKGPGRRLLFERELKNGCLVHETGVGTALLGQYIRLIFHKLANS